MVKKEKTRKEELTLWASPSWALKREGHNVNLISPAGFFPYKKEGMVEIKITTEEF